ncbi:MAG: hypothetical protein IB616_01535 [Methanosarcinales archaeon]|nr:MAG: hypothetical protein IB616_01535 [Methanosarcinales archaeon]
MKFKTKLWQRGKTSFASTVPRIVLLDLDPDEKKYQVIWERTESNKWSVTLKETESEILPSANE